VTILDNFGYSTQPPNPVSMHPDAGEKPIVTRVKPTSNPKLKLHGFNNLTKSLSFNIYDI
jgi:hypothetical protein